MAGDRNDPYDDPFVDDDPEGVEGEDARAREGDESAGFFPDLIRRGLTLGFTGVFMTEEAIRRALGDSVPRDVLEFFLEQSEKARNDFLDRVSKEFGRTLRALDPVDFATRLVEGKSIEVSAKIRILTDEKDESKP